MSEFTRAIALHPTRDNPEAIGRGHVYYDAHSLGDMTNLSPGGATLGLQRHGRKVWGIPVIAGRSDIGVWPRVTKAGKKTEECSRTRSREQVVYVSHGRIDHRNQLENGVNAYQGWLAGLCELWVTAGAFFFGCQAGQQERTACVGLSFPLCVGSKR